MNNREPIVIIGGGIGGLSAAVHLATAGRKVIVFEQNAAVGGKMSQFEAAGFRWDTGPSVITMRTVFEDLWRSAGQRLEDDLTLLPVDPLTRYFYGDGVVLDVRREPAAMDAAIAAIEPADVQGYRDFLAYAAEIHRITAPVFVESGPPSLASLRYANPLDLLRIDPWLTLDQAIARRVRSRHMRQMLGRFATYVGASPYQAPATLAVVAHVELAGGIWYPRGGIYRIAEAMRALAQRCGVTVHTASPVAQVLVRDGAACGVQLADGTEQLAAAVVSNVDVATTYRKLLPPQAKVTRRAAALARRETSCSGFVLMLGVEGVHPALAHHNIFFADDYMREFNDIFRKGIPPEKPTVYVAITSKSDPDHAPAGCENWFVLVNAPPISARFDWNMHAADYRARVLETLAQNGYNLTGRIRAERMLTPLDLERMSGAWRGALYGISSNAALNAFRRPNNRCADVPGVYFAGGTTHPGGGVPMVILSGRVAASMVLNDFA